MREKIKVVSMFSGCGGSDLGLLGGFLFNGKKYGRLPFEIVFALDNDPKAVATYNANFKHKAVVSAIEDCPVKKIPEFDLLIGGFPCQSFSTVNPTKNPFDNRAKLYKKMAHILAVKKPKFFVAENVKGLLVLKKGVIFRNVIREFSRRGYRISYALLNAADYGVPQRRERIFVIGIRNDIAAEFKFPTAIYSENGEKGKMWVGLRSAVKRLAIKDKKYYFSKRAVRGMKNAKNNMKRGLAQDIGKPCLTVTSHLAKVSLNSRDPVLLVNAKNELYRRFTPREAARIQSFPDSFCFEGSDANAYRQIGNAIPPVVMWHVASELVKSFKHSTRPMKKHVRHLLQEKKKRDNVSYPEQEYFNRKEGVPALAF